MFVKKYLKYVVACLFLLTTIIIILGRSTILTPDAAYHLKTGEWILSNKTIPKEDIYSWHPEKLVFIAHEWLYQVIIALIHKAGGMFALTIFTSALTMISYGLSLWRGKGYVLGSLLALFMIVCHMGKQIMLLPDSFGILLLMIMLFVVTSEKLNQKNKPYIVFGLGVIMANMHGGMLSVTLCMLIFLCIIDCIREHRLNRERFLYVMLAFVGGIFNPYGISIYKYIGVISTQSAKYNSDYMTYQTSGMIEVFLFVGIQALIVIGYIKKHEGKIVLTDDICLYVATLTMFLTYQRLINLYTYSLLAFGMPYCMVAIKDIKPKVKTIGVSVSCVISAFLLIVMLNGITLFHGTADSYIRQNLLSDEMLETLAKNDVVLYNNIDAGGYLIYEDIPVYLDGRTETYTHEFGNHDYYLESVNIDASPDYMDKLGYGFTHVLLRKGSVEARIYDASSTWERKLSNDNFILYIKNESEAKS